MGYVGIMEKKMETTIGINPITENQMEKKMENEMETGIYRGFRCSEMRTPLSP